MSTEPILSINRCFVDLHPSVTEDAQHPANLSLNEPDPEALPPEQQVINLHERMSRHKKEFTKEWI
ncbi:MAG TPA: hypothetical protein VFG54_15610 [Prolixibacteraceae bacterium]|nr:hypothetical protein [Prolixibacteraceae bacterium]